jgi:hypothetical protein
MMRSLLARLLFPYGSIRRVLFGPLQGYQYVVQPGMGLTYALGYGAGNDFLADRVESGEVVFDVGGNRGQFALFFAELVGEGGGWLFRLNPSKSWRTSFARTLL